MIGPEDLVICTFGLVPMVWKEKLPESFACLVHRVWVLLIRWPVATVVYAVNLPTSVSFVH